jgi:phage-related protein
MSNNQAQFQRIEAEERVLYEGEKRLSRGVVIGGAIGTGVLVTAIAALYYSHKSSAQTAQIGTLQSSVAQLQGTISQEQSYISQIPSIETTLQQLKTGQAANAKVLAQIESQIGPIVTPLDEAITAIQGISSAIAGLPTDFENGFKALESYIPSALASFGSDLSKYIPLQSIEADLGKVLPTITSLQNALASGLHTVVADFANIPADIGNVQSYMQNTIYPHITSVLNTVNSLTSILNGLPSTVKTDVYNILKPEFNALSADISPITNTIEGYINPISTKIDNQILPSLNTISGNVSSVLSNVGSFFGL